MNLKETSALITTVLVILGTVWYLRLALNGIKVRPVLASWIVLAGTMTLSFVTYWSKNPTHSLINNAANAIGVLSTAAVLAVVWWLTWKRKQRVKFAPLHKVLLWISLAIAIYWVVIVWVLDRSGHVPNILTQVLMLIGYFFTAEKLWKAKENTESLFLWWCLFIASAIALYPAITSKDWLALSYAGRATFASGTLVFLMHRAERKALQTPK